MKVEGDGWILFRGDYREIDDWRWSTTQIDALITDPPFSKRTHKGHSDLAATLEGRREITYPWWVEGDVAEFFDHWGDLDGWIVAFSDHVLAPEWEARALEFGRYAFLPIPWVSPGSRVRAMGDGPANWTCPINVSRPKAKRFMGWGSLPGAYVVTQDRGARIGGKPLALMRALVRDYSAPADRVCDPCAGYGTTLIAALIEGRRAIGCEIDPEAFDVAVERLRAGYTPATLWEPDRVPADQTELDL